MMGLLKVLGRLCPSAIFSIVGWCLGSGLGSGGDGGICAGAELSNFLDIS